MDVKTKGYQILQSRLLLQASQYSPIHDRKHSKDLVTGSSKRWTTPSQPDWMQSVVNFWWAQLILIGQFVEIQIHEALPIPWGVDWWEWRCERLDETDVDDIKPMWRQTPFP